MSRNLSFAPTGPTLPAHAAFDLLILEIRWLALQFAIGLATDRGNQGRLPRPRIALDPKPGLVAVGHVHLIDIFSHHIPLSDPVAGNSQLNTESIFYDKRIVCLVLTSRLVVRRRSTPGSTSPLFLPAGNYKNSLKGFTGHNRVTGGTFGKGQAEQHL